MTDAELLTDYRDHGSQESFAELVRRHAAALFSFCLRYCRSYFIAQEVVQETWLLVHLNCGRFRGDAKFSSWLFTIARNKALDVSQKMTLATSSYHDNLEEISQANHDHATPEEIESLAYAMNALDSKHRQAVRLVDFEEVTYESAAKLLGIPVGTVRSRRHRALDKLRKMMAA